MSKLAEVRARFDQAGTSSLNDGDDGKKPFILAAVSAGGVFIVSVLFSAVLLGLNRNSCVPPVASDRNFWTTSNGTYDSMDFDDKDLYPCLQKRSVSDAVVLPPRDVKTSTHPRSHVMWSNVTYIGSGDAMSNLRYSQSVFSGVKVLGATSAAGLGLADSYAQNITCHGPVAMDRLSLTASLARYVIFSSMVMLTRPQLYRAQIGSVFIKESVTLNRLKLREVVASEVTVGGLATMGSPDMYKATLQNVEVDYSLILTRPSLNQVTVENVTVHGDLTFTDSKVSSASLKSVEVEGSGVFGDMSLYKSRVEDFGLTADAVCRRVWGKLSSLVDVVVAGGLRVQTLKLVHFVIENLTLGRGAAIDSLNWSQVQVDALNVQMSVVAPSARIGHSQLSNVLLGGALEVRSLVMWKSTIQGVAIGGNALLSGADVSKVVMNDFVFGGIARFSKSRLSNVELDRGLFAGKAGFEGAHLYNVVFRNVTFAADVDFYKADLRKTQFIECTFKGPVRFDHARRGRGVRLVDAKFEAPVTWKRSSMRSLVRRAPIMPVSDLELPYELQPVYDAINQTDASLEDEPDAEYDYYDDLDL